MSDECDNEEENNQRDDEGFEDEIGKLREEIMGDHKAAKKIVLNEDKETLHVGQSFWDAKEVRMGLSRDARLVYKCIEGCPQT